MIKKEKQHKMERDSQTELYLENLHQLKLLELKYGQKSTLSPLMEYNVFINLEMKRKLVLSISIKKVRNIALKIP